MTPLVWLKIAAVVVAGALVFGGPAYELGHWRGHGAGLRDGIVAQKVADAAVLSAKNAEIAKLNSQLTPTQAKIEQAIRDAIADQPTRVRVVEKAITQYPEFAAIERPAELHAAKVSRLEAIAGAAR